MNPIFFFDPQALLHKYFFSHPLPCIERDLPRPESNHRELLKQEDSGESARAIEELFEEFVRIYDK